MRLLIILMAAALPQALSAQRMLPPSFNYSNTVVNDLAVYNGALYIASMSQVPPGTSVHCLERWAGGIDVDTIGPHSQQGAQVRDLLVYQGALICAVSAPGGPRVSRWNDTTWTQMGDLFNGNVFGLVEFDGDLLAYGSFTSCGTDPCAHMAKWDGTSWIAFDSGTDGTVYCATVSGGDLIIGGNMLTVNGIPCNRLARYDGGSWAQVGQGLSGTATDLAYTPHGLWIVGGFSQTADQLVQLNGSAVFDGQSLLPLLDHDITGLSNEIFYSTQWGHVISGNEGTFFNPENGGRKGQFTNVTCAVEYNGVTYCGGNFDIPSYRNIEGVGRLELGSSRACIQGAGMSACISTYGDLWKDQIALTPGFVVPAGSYNLTVEAVGLCAAASTNGQVRIMPNQLFGQIRRGIGPGPWCQDTNDQYFDRYHQVWAVDNGSVWGHLDNWATPGYQIPYTIENWPANGNVLNNEPSSIAPFDDQNGDGVYQPVSGEIPSFPGDFAILDIRSDQLAVPSSQIPPIGLDVVSFNFLYDVPSADPRHRVLFRQHRLINRSNMTLDTLWVGLRADIDIGMDDSFGCDTLLDLSFGYSRSSNTSPYAPHPPSIGIASLNADMHASLVNAANSSLYGQPEVDQLDTYYLLKGRLRNGASINTGFTSGVGTFMYPGDPVTGTGINQQTSFSFDDRMIISYGPWYMVEPGDTICLDLAILFAQDTLGDHLSSISALRQKTENLRTWYLQNAPGCGEYQALGIHGTQPPAPSETNVWPNPSSDLLNIHHPSGRIRSVSFHDMSGRTVRMLRIEGGPSLVRLPIGNMAAGPYVLRVFSDAGPISHVIMVQH